MLKWLVGRLEDRTVERWYLRSGEAVGNVVSSMPVMGEVAWFRGMVRRWRFWEAEYIRRGYRSISLNVFEDMGGYGIDPENVGKKMVAGEIPHFYAAEFRRRYFPKPKRVGQMVRMFGRA